MPEVSTQTGTKVVLHSSSVCHTKLTHELCHMFYSIISGLDLNDQVFLFFKEITQTEVSHSRLFWTFLPRLWLVVPLAKPGPVRLIIYFNVTESALPEKKARPPDTKQPNALLRWFEVVAVS